jgi:hypothetical protein
VNRAAVYEKESFLGSLSETDKSNYVHTHTKNVTNASQAIKVSPKLAAMHLFRLAVAQNRVTRFGDMGDCLLWAVP